MAILSNLCGITQKPGRDVPDISGTRPQTVPGTLPRHTDHQIPLSDLYSFFISFSPPKIALLETGSQDPVATRVPT